MPVQAIFLPLNSVMAGGISFIASIQSTLQLAFCIDVTSQLHLACHCQTAAELSCHVGFHSSRVHLASQYLYLLLMYGCITSQCDAILSCQDNLSCQYRLQAGAEGLGVAAVQAFKPSSIRHAAACRDA